MCYRAELEHREEQYDVIIGDLADPIEGGPCYKLYTKSFYELIVKPRLSKEGIFVTQVSNLTHLPHMHAITYRNRIIMTELTTFFIYFYRQVLLEFSAIQKCFLAFTIL